jgi:hypothetical protein
LWDENRKNLVGEFRKYITGYDKSISLLENPIRFTHNIELSSMGENVINAT